MNLNKYNQIYKKQGFIIVKNVFSKYQIKSLLTELELVKIKVEKKGKNQHFHKTKDGKFNTIHNIQTFHKSGKIFDLTKNKTLLKIISYLLDSAPVLRNIEFFLKPKKTGLSTPFHQDNFYWNIVSAKALNVWIACTNVSKKNGGVCYLQGSHNLGTIKHEISYAKGSSQKISEKVLSFINFKKIFPKISPGDCIIHHPEIIHGSYENKSNLERIGFVISFISKKAKIDKVSLNKYKNNLKKNLSSIYN